MCMYMYMYVYMCVYVYIYIYIYTHVYVCNHRIFVASDRDSVVQCEGGMVFLGRRERPLGATLDMTANQVMNTCHIQIYQTHLCVIDEYM